MPAVKKRKKMRVAITVTGAAAAAAGVFAPAGVAKAATPGTDEIWVYTAASVTDIQLCGYRDPAGTWHCTVKHVNPHHGAASTNYLGSDWIPSKFNVWEWNGTAEAGHTCYTSSQNGWNGFSRIGGLDLTAPFLRPLGMSNGIYC